MGFELFNHLIPYYGLCIVIGSFFSGLLAYFLCKFKKYDFNDFIILSCYLFIFGFVGAKILYVIVSFKSINFKAVFSNLNSFNSFLNSGFVFYGGIFGGFLGLFVVKKIHKINVKKYLKIISPCLSLIHSFGRIGCSLVGCCYGKEYNGIFHITYDKSPFAPNDINLFPVQLIESIFLMVITIIQVILILKKSKIKVELIYFLLYSILRFSLEFFRGDLERGFFYYLSTSQIISLIIFFASLILLIKNHIKNKKK